MKRTVTVGLALAASLCGLAGTASATTVPNSNGGSWCNTFTAPVPGVVCIDAEANGYNASYWNTSLNSYLVDFNLVTDSGIRVGDQGPFVATPNSTHTYFFATGNLGCARVYLYARKAGWQLHSPDDSAGGLCAAP